MTSCIAKKKKKKKKAQLQSPPANGSSKSARPKSKSDAASYKLQSLALGTKQVSPLFYSIPSSTAARLCDIPAARHCPIAAAATGQPMPPVSYPANQGAQSPGVAALVQIFGCP
jgi:hypothetical protein